MVDVKDYLQKSGGNWLRADNVQVGDRLQPLDDCVIDDQTFDRSYLVFTVLLQRTGEQFKLRLGPKNTARIAENLGNDTSKWKNGQLEVISIETYSGLGQRGILLRGLPLGQQEKLAAKPPKLGEPTPDALKLISESRDIVELGIPLNEQDWSQTIPAKVRAELLKLGLIEKKPEGYFFTEAAKAFL